MPLLCGLLFLAGCAGGETRIEGPVASPVTDGTFSMPDGTSLPYRQWLPESTPIAVVLALHGFNDSRDAWELPGPAMAAQGVAVIAPDQRGFGASATRGFWPGGAVLEADAAEMLRQLRARYPGRKLFVMGESMGGAVAILLASHAAPPVDGYVLLAPAIWGRETMNVFLRAILFFSTNLLPGVTVTGNEVPLKVQASDNREALIRLARDPLTIRHTRIDTIGGLVDLMDQALAKFGTLREDTLVLYGAKDTIVPDGAMATAWHKLGPGPRTGFYAQGYHLLLRDLGRDLPRGDLLAWMRDRAGALPSGAEDAARRWRNAAHEP